MSWYRVGRGQWKFIVWPHEPTDENGHYTTEHPFWRKPEDQPKPHEAYILPTSAACEKAAEDFLMERAK